MQSSYLMLNQEKFFTTQYGGIDEADIYRAAYNYAKTVAFRTYYLSSDSHQLVFNIDEPLHYYALGCHGDGGPAQHVVAKMLNDEIAQSGNAPCVIIFNGDNQYDNNNPYQRFFKDVYLKEELHALKKQKINLIGGNHDANIERISFGEYGQSVLLHQVAQTYAQQIKKYLTDGSAKTIDQALDKVKTIFENKINHPTLGEIYLLNTNDLLAWNMYSPAFSLVAGNVQFFCLDSNQLGEDIANYINQESSDNQVNGFIQAHKDALTHNRLPILIMHNPVNSPGKRAYQKDFSYYCKDKNKRISIYKTLGLDPNKEHSNGQVIDTGLQLLRKKCAEQEHDFKVKIISHAHDHAGYVAKSHIDDKDLNYYDAVTGLGMGGGKLQDRKHFGNQQLFGGFFRAYGFGKFVINQKNHDVQLSLHTSNGKANHQQIFKFDVNDVTQPLRSYPENILQEEFFHIIKLSVIIKRGIDNYFAFLHTRQEQYPKGEFLNLNLSHGQKGVRRAHELWKLISVSEASTYEQTVSSIYKILHDMTNENNVIHKLKNKLMSKIQHLKFFAPVENEHSLKEYIDHELLKPTIERNSNDKILTVTEQEGFGMNLDQLFSERFLFSETKSKTSKLEIIKDIDTESELKQFTVI